jgi:tetratricopeptide (TPR) repeat protein
VSSISSKGSRLRLVLGVAAVVTGGCAAPGSFPELPPVTELTAVPFFPQTELDCGPAALATVLVDAGIDTTPEALMPSVFTEGLEGSLQIELLTAARREGRLPIRIETAPETLFEFVRAGYPVLVMQNLRLPRAPLWHYAVVVGYEAESGRVLLRSGDERRKRQRARRFATSWDLADNWGFVLARPGTVPEPADPEGYLRAVVESTRALDATAVDAAYAAALERWPDEPDALFLGGSHAFGQGRLDEAVSLYRRAIDIEPGHAAARNNLANVLLERGCHVEAEREARVALEREAADGPFRDAILDTLGSIRSAADRYRRSSSINASIC